MSVQRLLLLVIPALLSACATTKQTDKDGVVSVNSLAQRAPMVAQASAPPAPVPVVKEKVDENCASVARFARLVATIRDAGVVQRDVVMIASAPTSFPAGPIIREVFARTDISPELGEVNSYGVCREITYQVMLRHLVEAEAKFMAEETKKADEATRRLLRQATRPTPRK